MCAEGHHPAESVEPTEDKPTSTKPLTQHVQALRAAAKRCRGRKTEPLGEELAQWLTAQYAAAAQIAATESTVLPLETLRRLTADVVLLRRGDHHAAGVRIRQERLKLEQEREARRRRKEEPPKKPRGLTPAVLRQIEEAAKML